MTNANVLRTYSMPAGVFTAYLLTKIVTRKSLFEISCFTKSPARTLAFFFYGVAWAGLYNLDKIREDESFVKDYQFKRRVEENRRAQSIMEGVRHKLDVSTSTPQTRSSI